MDPLLPPLPASEVLSPGTAVYRTVRTVVWEDGAPTNGAPPTRLSGAAALARRGGRARVASICRRASSRADSAETDVSRELRMLAGLAAKSTCRGKFLSCGMQKACSMARSGCSWIVRRLAFLVLSWANVIRARRFAVFGLPWTPVFALPRSKSFHNRCVLHERRDCPRGPRGARRVRGAGALSEPGVTGPRFGGTLFSANTCAALAVCTYRSSCRMCGEWSISGKMVLCESIVFAVCKFLDYFSPASWAKGFGEGL